MQLFLTTQYKIAILAAAINLYGESVKMLIKAWLEKDVVRGVTDKF